MNFKSLYEKIDRSVHIYARRRGVNASGKHYLKMLDEHNIPIKRLTPEQKAEVKKIWGDLMDYGNFATHELALSVTGAFDPYICSELMFRTNIELKLNDFQLKWGWSDKNYFDMFFPDIPMPKTVLRNVNGVLLDSEYRPVTGCERDKILTKYDKLIVKPSIENGFGRSVKLYEKADFEKIETDFKSNYLVQELFRQHSTLSALNPSSVNVVRVISLALNGKVSPVNYALRCGASGSITDNQITSDGRGMFIIGVEKDGTLKDKAVYSCGELISEAPNGQQFAGVRLPNFEKALEMTTKIHEKMPHFGFVGFDICFADDGTPTVMEYNIKGPGVLYYQYVNGPLFGERTQEVIDTFSKSTKK